MRLYRDLALGRHPGIVMSAGDRAIANCIWQARFDAAVRALLLSLRLLASGLAAASRALRCQSLITFR